MKKTDLAYTAGIVDGEGYIAIKKYGNKYGYRCSRVEVGNTNEWLINWLYFSFGGSKYEAKSTKANPRARRYWKWYISSNEAVEFLKLIMPYIRIKRTQAELALSFQGNKPSRGKNSKNSKDIEKRKAVEEAQAILMSSYHKEWET